MPSPPREDSTHDPHPPDPRMAAVRLDRMAGRHEAVAMSDRIERAVTEAANRMAYWRKHRLDTDRRANGKREKEAPDAPLVKLREQGVITVEEEVRLTSKAYARSLEL